MVANAPTDVASSSSNNNKQNDIFDEDSLWDETETDETAGINDEAFLRIDYGLDDDDDDNEAVEQQQQEEEEAELSYWVEEDEQDRLDGTEMLDEYKDMVDRYRDRFTVKRALCMVTTHRR